MGHLKLLLLGDFLPISFTLPETNITPENRPSQKQTSIPTIHFQVRAVSFRECKFFFVYDFEGMT